MLPELPPFRPALLAFDLDGTLIPDQDRHLTEETSSLLAELCALNIKLAIITGRDGLSERMRTDGHLHAEAANNGGTIRVGDQVIYAEKLKPEDLELLLRHGLTGAEVVIYGEAGYAVPADSDAPADWMQKHGVTLLTDEGKQTAYKVRFHHPEAAAYANHLRATQPQLVVTGGIEPYLNFVSVTPRQATKSIALKRIAAALNAPLAYTVAFGDSDNDADLLEAAGFAVQIGTHPHLTPHADVQLNEQAELPGYLRRLIAHLRAIPS